MLISFRLFFCNHYWTDVVKLGWQGSLLCCVSIDLTNWIFMELYVGRLDILCFSKVASLCSNNSMKKKTAGIPSHRLKSNLHAYVNCGHFKPTNNKPSWDCHASATGQVSETCYVSPGAVLTPPVWGQWGARSLWRRPVIGKNCWLYVEIWIFDIKLAYNH